MEDIFHWLLGKIFTPPQRTKLEDVCKCGSINWNSKVYFRLMQHSWEATSFWNVNFHF
jgi:hypothetical protein